MPVSDVRASAKGSARGSQGVIENAISPRLSISSVVNIRRLLPPTRPATTSPAVTAPAPKTPMM